MKVILIKFAYRLYLLCQEIIQHRKKMKESFSFHLEMDVQACKTVSKKPPKTHVFMPKFMLD